MKQHFQMSKLKSSQKLFAIQKSCMSLLVLTIFGGIYMSCMSCGEPAVPIQIQQPAQEIIQSKDTIIEDTTTIDLSESEPEERIQLGQARFFEDSVYVEGEGFKFQRHTPYGRVLILFDDDGKITKVETMTSLPFRQVDKNTIYLLKGATLTNVSRYFKVPIQKLWDCNPNIKNPDRIPALTYLKLNCQ